MNKFKELAFALLLAVPMIVSASGMGVYLPLSFGDSGTYTFNPDDTDIEFDEDRDYKPAAGLGLAFDTNIGKDKLFNYRLGLEYMQREVDEKNGNPCTFECTSSRVNMVNTFGFGVLRTKTVRLWVGPRLNIAWNWQNSDDYQEYAFEIGIAPAIGVNVNLGRVVSLGFDADYRFASTGGVWSFDDIDFNGDYSGTTRGATARFYVLFRFGETFDGPVMQSAVDSSI